MHTKLPWKSEILGGGATIIRDVENEVIVADMLMRDLPPETKVTVVDCHI